MALNEARVVNLDIPTSGSAAATLAKRLVVATDLSPACDVATRRALLLAQLHGASVLLLHVVERRADEARDAAARRARAALADWYGPTGRRGRFELEIRVETGAIADTIASVADFEGADLLVFGEPGSRLFADILGGGTMEQAMCASGLPALTVRLPPRRPYSSIVLGLDRGERARQVVEGALTLDLAAAPSLAAVHAFTTCGKSRMVRAGIDRREIDEHVARAAVEAAAELRALLARTGVAERRPALRVAEADPFHAIARAAEATAADLVVVGQRASRLARLLRGSIAAELLRRVRADLLAVPTFPPPAGATDAWRDAAPCSRARNRS